MHRILDWPFWLGWAGPGVLENGFMFLIRSLKIERILELGSLGIRRVLMTDKQGNRRLVVRWI